jgi:hypothetical protein
MNIHTLCRTFTTTQQVQPVKREISLDKGQGQTNSDGRRRDTTSVSGDSVLILKEGKLSSVQTNDRKHTHAHHAHLLVHDAVLQCCMKETQGSARGGARVRFFFNYSVR